MFWFSRKKKNKTNVKFFENESVSFQDMLQQPLDISVKKDGNLDVLRIFSQTKTKTSEFLLDREQCLLFSEILRDYASSGNLNKTKQLFVEE